MRANESSAKVAPAVVVAVWQVFVIAIVILAEAPTLQSGDFVFTHYYNDTGFSSKSYVVAIGVLATLFSFSGRALSLDPSRPSLAPRFDRCASVHHPGPPSNPIRSDVNSIRTTSDRTRTASRAHPNGCELHRKTIRPDAGCVRSQGHIQSDVKQHPARTSIRIRQPSALDANATSSVDVDIGRVARLAQMQLPASGETQPASCSRMCVRSSLRSGNLCRRMAHPSTADVMHVDTEHYLRPNGRTYHMNHRTEVG